MIAFLKTWVNQIIVALIIATICEMILPNGNNKKYIKMIIGLYVLFTIMYPIVTKVLGQNDLKLSNFDYKKYFEESDVEIASQNFEDSNSKLIEQTYINNIKSDIEMKVKQKGYKVISCQVNILDNTNSDKYGTLESIELQVKKEKQTSITQNTIKIQEINIGSNKSTEKVTGKLDLSDEEKKELVAYLASEYSIEKNKISINNKGEDNK